MHIAINGWFVNQLTAGSSQYLHHLLAYLPTVLSERHSDPAPVSRVSLLLPDSQLSRGVGTVDNDIDTLTYSVVTPFLPPLPRNLQKLWWEQVSVPWAARRLGVDVLWVPYWAAPFWQPCPVAVTVHDVIPRLLPAYRGGRIQQWYTGLVSHTARKSAAILTVSHASAKDICAILDIPSERVYVVHHGPNRQGELRPTPAELRAVGEKYDLPERFFLYLGGFDVRKNVEGTLVAYKRYLELGGNAGVKLVIAGKLPENDSDFAPDPRRIASRLTLENQVYFCGWIEEKDKSVLYTLATAFIFPSTYEGFGMPVLEAMAAGTPVITSAH